MKAFSYINNWLNICCILVFLMVLVGGGTRLTQSGLSMVDWKPIMGIFPPLSNLQWEESFEKYQQFPEYQQINKFKNMNLAQYKSIFYWEYLHRMLGRIIGLVYIIPFLIFYKRGYVKKKYIIPFLSIISLVVIQGILGWYMVKSGLVENPHVSHFRLAAHLLLAFFLLAYTFWIKVNYKDENNKIKLNDTTNNRRHNILIFLFVLQVLFGAFIAGTKAGLLWNTFPLIEGKLVPTGLFALTPFYDNFLNNMKMFQFAHRVIGTFLILYSGWFFLKTAEKEYSKYTRFLFMVFLMQFYIGIMTLLMRVPFFMGVVHQALAMVILILIVKIKYLIIKS